MSHPEELRKQYEIKIRDSKDKLYQIEKIIRESGEKLEGNCFYYDETLDLYHDLLPKQINLFWAGSKATFRLCEIGFNAGHSSLLFILGRDQTPLEFTIFDIGHHKYTLPTMKYLKKTFPYVKMEYIEGDSIQTILKWIFEHPHYMGTYDVVHVDGGHGELCVINDMKNADLLLKIGGIMIIDDTNNSFIDDKVYEYLMTFRYEEIEIMKTIGYKHRMIRKIC